MRGAPPGHDDPHVSVAETTDDGLVPPSRSSNAEIRRVPALVLHLARRELQTQHRFTLLRWLWPLVRQLAMLAVLVFVFSRVLDLGIDDFPLFVFTGLLLWGWFSSGVSMATTALLERRHLVFSPRFPAVAIPLAAILVPLVDALMVLPILLVALAVEGRLEATALLLPPILVVVLALTAGVALITSALNVYLRDVRSAVTVGLLMLFYLTPIFYSLDNIPHDYEWVLRINPLTAVVNATRDVLMYGSVPALTDVAIAVPTAAGLFAVGWLLFARLEPDFVDEV